MNRRSVAGLVISLSLFLLAGGCNPQKPVKPVATFKFGPPPATAPQETLPPDLHLTAPHLSQTPSHWEYKVVRPPQDGEQELTKLLNEMSKDGWEFAGQLQTKETYLVLRRTKSPRDYIRSRGDLLPPDVTGRAPTGKEALNPTSREALGSDRFLPIRPPLHRSTAPATRKDTRPTGLPRLGERSEQ